MKNLFVNILSLVIILSFFLISCDSIKTGDYKADNKSPYPEGYKMSLQEKEEILKKRVSEFWDAKIIGDSDKLYGLHDPFYRAAVPLNVFKGRILPFRYHSYQIIDIKIEDLIAKVTVLVKYSGEIQGKVKPFKVEDEKPTTVSWIFIDGNWFYQFEDFSNDFTYVKY